MSRVEQRVGLSGGVVEWALQSGEEAVKYNVVRAVDAAAMLRCYLIVPSRQPRTSGAWARGEGRGGDWSGHRSHAISTHAA